jgi:SAM-dependent methyltransferase
MIFKLQDSGATIYALNGAARLLNSIGIIPDYQVVIDARPETSSIVDLAKTHLFASQVHPDCFEVLPVNVKLWHLQVEGIDEHLPPYDDDYCLVGGAASVGNTATCLAYAMGFRDLQLFGFDSSNKPDGTTFGQSHAIHQAINDGEPMASVTFNGKDYISSLTMKLQAEKFQETAKALKELGCSIAVHGYGLLPDMYNAPPEVLTEHEKYTKMWKFPQYRAYSPGEQIAGRIIELLNISELDSVVDFGCGTGRAAKFIQENTLCHIACLDFTKNSMDDGLFNHHGISFFHHDLKNPIDFKRHQKGYCTDVMEHIPPDDVDLVINNIMDAASKVVFQISLVPDCCGALIGHDLHLSVHPAQWWVDTFNRLGFDVPLIEESADKTTCIFLVKREAKKWLE